MTEHVINLTGDEANKLAQCFHGDFHHGVAKVGEAISIKSMANLIRAYGDERVRINQAVMKISAEASDASELGAEMENDAQPTMEELGL